MVMAEVIMLVGGSRSGKSGYAEKLAAETAERNSWPVYYIATAFISDPEFADRVEKHRQRRPAAWHTVEENCDLGKILQSTSQPAVFLIDGIGTWVANLMYRDNYPEFSWGTENEKVFWQYLTAFVHSCSQARGTVILVADEVGMGIVPENLPARVFRDLNGWANQRLAQEAARLYHMVCGIPLQVK
jgi:adenosylcobinamide kinase/adenosylcobinamide-phosphate guanylyltransferase